MRKRLFKTVALSFVLSLLLPLLPSCGSEKAETGGDVTVWAASSTEKIFRDERVEDTSQKTMRISMAKNEYEGAQLMMYSETDAGAYEVEVSDLVCGDHIISKDNIGIYNVKYISSTGIGSKYNNESLPAGSSMPDALLPFETAVEYGENILPKGKNQSVYIEVYTPPEAAAGTYKGTVRLTVGDYAYYMTVYVTVIEYLVPDNPSTKNYFARWGREHYVSAELDCTDEMDEKYFEAMLKYRMGSTLPFEGEGGTERYVELLRKYYDAPGFAAYKFFYEATYSVYNDILIAYNVPLCKEYLKAVIKASIEDGTDYLEKAFFYFSTFVDEPDSNPSVTWDMVADISKTVNKMLKDVAEEADIEFAAMSDYAFYKNKVRNSLLTIPNIIPGGYQISSLEACGAEDITACTVLDKFDSESARLSYRRENMETWWYTCINPQYPYPNLLANSPIVGVRLISWMQKDYDIDGFLIWDAVNYTTSDNNGIPIVDTYSYLTNSFSGVSDGKIFYPGKPYGIEGPVASLRAAAYRDGMEDYEILNGIYEAYAQQGLDASDALESIYSQLFSGTVTTGDSGLFGTVREEAFSLLSSCRGDFAIYWGEISYKNDDAEVAFKVPSSSASVSADGKALSKGADGLYRVSLKSSEKTSLTVSVTVGGGTKNYTKYVFGKYAEITGFEDGMNTLVSVNTSSEAGISSENASSGDKSLKITLNGKVGEDSAAYTPWFSVDAGIFGGLEETESLIFDIYSEEEMRLNAVARYGAAVTYEKDVTAIFLKRGRNHIEMEIPSSVKALENVKEFRFKSDNILLPDGSAGSLNLYLDNIGYRTDENTVVSGAADKGEIIVRKAEKAAASGNRQSLILAEDERNVTEDGYLMLADFENYNQAAQIRYTNNFGKIELVTETPFVTHGSCAAKLTIVGRGEEQRHYDPIMVVYTNQDYFQKQDFSDVDYIEIDMYNAMDYELTVRFTDTTIYYSKYTLIETITLKPGTNHIRISLDGWKAKNASTVFDTFCFVFDRGELFGEDRIVYVDNFRAHYAE